MELFLENQGYKNEVKSLKYFACGENKEHLLVELPELLVMLGDTS